MLPEVFVVFHVLMERSHEERNETVEDWVVNRHEDINTELHVFYYIFIIKWYKKLDSICMSLETLSFIFIHASQKQG